MELGSLPSSDDEIGIAMPNQKKDSSKKIMMTGEIDIEDLDS